MPGEGSACQPPERAAHLSCTSLPQRVPSTPHRPFWLIPAEGTDVCAPILFISL